MCFDCASWSFLQTVHARPPYVDPTYSYDGSNVEVIF